MATAKKAAPSSTKAAKRTASATPDAIALLRADHAAVTAMFEKYETLKRADQKQALATKICQELQVHTTIEEEIFYSELRAAKKTEEVDDMLDEADVEHDGAKKLIAEIQGSSPDEELYDARVKVLSEYIRHHVKEEQSDIFPAAKKSGLNLRDMGVRLAQRKKELKRELAA